MPNFKPKSKKKFKIGKKYILTLDSTHQEKIKEFNKIENIIIPDLKQKLKQFKIKLKENETSREIKYNINYIKKQIKHLKNKKKKYFLNNSKYIFDYFEKKKGISEGTGKKKTLNSFFNKIEHSNNDNYENNIIQKYLQNIDDKYINMNNFSFNNEKCKFCSGELIIIDNEGILVCKKCYQQTPYLIENEKPSYKEPPKEVCFYAYKRINHFREILAQFQAKETTMIPDQILIDIKNQIKKERIDICNITNTKAKDILKKLGYNKYYEHIPFIKEKLGIKPPIMSPELEEKLCNLFMEIQRPYSLHCPVGRVNFLNYYYVLYKMCELLNENKFLQYFPMLKDPVKRIEQDEIWKKICKELNWKYKPTI